MRRLIKRPLAFLLFSIGLIGVYTVLNMVPVFSLPDGTLGPYSPHRASSSPDGAHTFLMRKNNLGKNTQLQISSYYPVVGTDWGKEYIYIDPYLTCDVDFDSDTQPGSVTYMRVALTAGSTTDTYRIKIDKQTGLNNVCSVTPEKVNDVADNGTDKNKLFARYPLPGSKPAEDDQTKLLKVTVEIAYESIVTTPTKSDTKNNQQRFQVRAQTKAGGSFDDNKDALLGPTGGNDGGIADSKFNFPILGRPEHYDTSTDISVPFGLPCNATSNQTKRVGIYDADSFPGPPVKFKVKDMGDGESAPTDNVDFRDGNNQMTGTPARGNFSTDWFTPSQLNKAKSDVEITMKPDHKYQIQVTNVDGGNTIVINVPTETIFGVIGCGWKMRPDSSVNPSVQEPGKSVTFTHTATNTGSFKSDPVTSKVKWGQNGVLTTGTVSTDTDRVYNPDNNTRDKVFTNTFTIPATATDGQRYCQYLEVKPHSKKDSSTYDSWQKGDRACVTVRLPPPSGGEQVGVTPVVNANMNDIEPTETATFDGYVNITNFPRLWDDEWGYTEVAKQRPATRVGSTKTTDGLESQSRPATRTETTPNIPYPCGNDPSKTCYKCPAGYTASGSGPGKTCSKSVAYTEYRYKCKYSTTWGSWGGSAPSCKDYYTCDGGAAGSGWYFSAPSCQGWKCQYAPYTQVNQATAPSCEYRCSNGTGLRAPQSNGWTGDMNCYQPPSFTLTCYWKNKPLFAETVTADGRYCNNRDVDANEVGVTIGTPVRAVLTANYPGNNAWSSPPPGYQLNRQVVLWGWNNFPSRSAQDIVRVVGRPITKVLGGDVAAGSAFVTNGTCGNANGSIFAWPKAGRWDAAGTQLAASASGGNTGFSTGMINSSLKPRSLSFANLPASSGENMGGNFGPMPCAADHYGSRPSTLINLTNLNNLNGSSANGAYSSGGGTISNNLTINKGQRIAVYATGNVYIRGAGSNASISYRDRGTWTTVEDIPAFKLVVYGGDIRIDKDVTQLDGIYIAQPNGGTGGNIYTCATSTGPYAENQRYNNCNNQSLTVNGAFIAKKVYFHRTKGTQVFGSLPGQTAEQFNYLPELWLANWPQNNQASEVKYDAITNLPPVL